MARNGAGVYNLLTNTWNPAINGVTATAADWQNLINDVAAALTQSVSSDGQTPLTGNLPMGNNRITGLAAGTAITDAVNKGQVSLNVGQCRLVKSGANLLLVPYQGNSLAINGVVCTIPTAGVTLAPTALTPGTTYYIYAVATGTAVGSIEASTTGHTLDLTTGVEIKTGDPTRTLVGMARPITGPAWNDTADQRFVMSWFNQRTRMLNASSGVSANYLLSTPAELNSAYRCQWLQWANAESSFSITGLAANNAQPNTVTTSLVLDGSTTLSTVAPTVPINNGGVNISHSTALSNPPSEGFHYVTFFASTSGGTATWTNACFVSGQVQG